MTAPRRRWTPEESQAWYARQPWLVGCNYIPATSVNQLEMWQAETFDLPAIDRELGWAADLGFNTLRVFLHDLLWRQDRAGFTDRVDGFLAVAHGHGMSVLFVLFDGVWDPAPGLGAQRLPRPYVHNPGWVQSPGADVLSDPARHAETEGYVRGIIGEFRDDPRILGWDLFNEPDNPNLGTYADREPTDKPALVSALMGKAFHWARSVSPSQPLTAGVWWGAVRGDGVPEINRLMLSESDVISFHSYYSTDRVASYIQDLQWYERPILLTEYLARGSGSTFEAILPLAKDRKVGAFNWGLVSGKTQTIYPWDSWLKTYSAEPNPWFHDILRPDGTPYREEEAALLRRLTRGADSGSH